MSKILENCPLCHEGGISSRVISRDGGVASEIEYNCTVCGIVGYWAYGSWDPAYPYPIDEDNEWQDE